jgi:multiple sugar transport system ATP-binding protein
MSRIRFEGVTKAYKGVVALDRVDLEVAPGSLAVLCGPPRSGKSVLFRLLAGLEAPDAGRILFDGRDITGVPAAERTLGYVPQSFALFPHLSVFDNIAYPLALQSVARPEIARRVAEAAELLRIGALLPKRPAQLSGGEKQRAAIARGILKNADLFILDDPLVGLDFKLRERLMDDLKEMRRALNATFLYATSDSLEALTMAQDLAVLDAGRLIQTGPAASVYLRPAHVRAAEMIGFPRCNVLPGRVADGSCATAAASFPLAGHVAAGPVLVAIRPEHLMPAGEPDADGVGEVTLIEDLGAECVVYLTVAGQGLVTLLPAAQAASLDLGSRFAFALRPGTAALFSPVNGQRVGEAQAAEAALA